MKNLPIDWDSVPDVMNKDQFYQLCHISKSTALYLLKSGKVPCELTGKKTRCYKIKKEALRAYLEERAVYPELYSAPVDGTTVIVWLSSPKNSPRMYSGKCTIIVILFRKKSPNF